MVGVQDDASSSGDERMEPDQAVVRAGYRSLMDDIAVNEEELGDVANSCHTRLRDYMENNEALFEQVTAPQEAVLDARVIKQLSRLCRQQAEQLSANIATFSQAEFAEKLVGNMAGGEAGAAVTRRKWVLLGRQVQSMFRRSPALTYMYGALDTTPPPPKERKAREGRGRQATRVADLVATQDTVLAEAETSDNQTEALVGHVFKCLVGVWREQGKTPVNLFRFVINPDSFGITVENLFHLSFLVKEGKVAITADEGLPHILPLTKRRQGGEGEGEKNQVVMNINMEDWRRMKEALGVTSAAITRVTRETREGEGRVSR